MRSSKIKIKGIKYHIIEGDDKKSIELNRIIRRRKNKLVAAVVLLLVLISPLIGMGLYFIISLVVGPYGYHQYLLLGSFVIGFYMIVGFPVSIPVCLLSVSLFYLAHKDKRTVSQILGIE